jgi:hypothetical protein
MAGCLMTMLRHPLIRQILPLVTVSYFRGLKNTLLKREKNLRLNIFQCLNSIPGKDYENQFKNWIKRLKLYISHGGEY